MAPGARRLRNACEPGVGDRQLANRMRPLGDGLRARSRGRPRIRDTVSWVSEFGRTGNENGNGGTDHGPWQRDWVMGGPVCGRGRVYGTWPGLASEKLHENRDLAITTDFREWRHHPRGTGASTTAPFAAVLTGAPPREAGVVGSSGPEEQ